MRAQIMLIVVVIVVQISNKYMFSQVQQKTTEPLIIGSRRRGRYFTGPIHGTMIIFRYSFCCIQFIPNIRTVIDWAPLLGPFYIVTRYRCCDILKGYELLD